MKFNEWQEAVTKQQTRLNELALSEVVETLTVDGKVIVITLGKNTLTTRVDGSEIAMRYLRTIYTNHKEEFDAVLESLTESTDKVCEATETILLAVSDEGIPDAVLNRMKGEKVSGDPAELVRAMVEKKLKELQTLVREMCKNTLFKVADIELEFAGKTLFLHSERYGGELTWGRLVINLRDHVSIPDIEEATYFLANYSSMKDIIARLIKQIKAIR